MAQYCLFLQLRYYFLIFCLQIFVSGEWCCRRWSFQPLVTGGYGCARSVEAAYSARKCLLRGHHLALVSTRKLVCIKDEKYATRPMLPTATFQTTVTSHDNSSEKINQVSKSNPIQNGNSDETTSTLSSASSSFTEESTGGVPNFTDKITFPVLSSETEVGKMTTQKVVADLRNVDRAIIGSKSELLKDTKLPPDLIEFTEKEKLTKSLVCCNPSLNK